MNSFWEPFRMIANGFNQTWEFVIGVIYLPIAVLILISMYTGSYTQNRKYVSYVEDLQHRIDHEEDMEDLSYWCGVLIPAVGAVVTQVWWLLAISAFFFTAYAIEFATWKKAKALM